jgi:hypothetical protein
MALKLPERPVGLRVESRRARPVKNRGVRKTVAVLLIISAILLLVAAFVIYVMFTGFATDH